MTESTWSEVDWRVLCPPCICSRGGGYYVLTSEDCIRFWCLLCSVWDSRELAVVVVVVHTDCQRGVDEAKGCASNWAHDIDIVCPVYSIERGDPFRRIRRIRQLSATIVIGGGLFTYMFVLYFIMVDSFNRKRRNIPSVHFNRHQEIRRMQL